MKLKTIKQVKNLEDKTVILRCDFNVPIKRKQVVDGYKIDRSIPTIEYLLKKKANIILLSHLGRPDGKLVKELSLSPVKRYVEKKLKQKIKLVAVDKIKSIKKITGITMIENIRYSKDEKKNTGSLAEDISGMGDIFVLDGFAVSHRPSASVVGIAKYLPSYAGLLMEQEIKGLEKLVRKPKKPFIVVLGGAKMETKIPVMKNLVSKANYVLVGGGIVNTYLFARGYYVGSSICDRLLKKEALKYGNKRKVIMPVDVVVGDFKGKKYEVVKVDKKFKIKKTQAILDIGPETVKLYSKYIKKAQTLVWNGAMGYFEQHPYQYGTHSIAELFASRSKGKAFGVCGGGETVKVLRNLKILSDIDLVSTGGGALLEYLSGKKLPGVKILSK